MDGVVGIVKGLFEFDVWPWRRSGPMVKLAVGERAAELVVEEDEEQRDPNLLRKLFNQLLFLDLPPLERYLCLPPLQSI